MHLKVGELARRTGVTVRTLHHYDEIGLLKPSGRSEGGYRLYVAADVARLHSIQALRQLGLALADIGPLLDGSQAGAQAILAQQMQALEQQIRQATELRDRLMLLHEGFLRGQSPELADWLRALSLMTTYGKYFSSTELKEILGGWSRIEADWDPLKAEVQSAMDRGAAIDSPAVQLLARRWMVLMHRWMGGDFARMERWGDMYRLEPGAHDIAGAPSAAMLAFIESAIALRLRLLAEHFGPHLQAVGSRMQPDPGWARIETATRRVMEQARPPARQVRSVVDRWLALVDAASEGDPDLKHRLVTLHLGHPLLLVGSPLSGEARAWLLDQARARGLDPHAT